MVISREQQSEENYNTKIGKKSMDGVEHTEYFGINLIMKLTFVKKLRAV